MVTTDNTPDIATMTDTEFHQHLDRVADQVDELGHILTAHRVIRELQQRGIPAQLGDLPESALCHIDITGNDTYTFHLGDTGWTVLKDDPTSNDIISTVNIDSPINDLPATMPPHEVAIAIHTHLVITS